ncbi:MAG: hypothetical protein CMJ47_02870 [Planctomyces sp.]|nr:hypothetical protein [Planctomyces sp.]
MERLADGSPAPRLVEALDVTSESGLKDMTAIDGGILTAGQNAIFAGPPKAGKTTMALETALCLQSGADFLEHPRFKVKRPGRVMFASLEASRYIVSDTTWRLLEFHELEEYDISELLFCFDTIKLHDRQTLRWLKDKLKSECIDYLFIDPLYLALKATKSSSLFSMGQRLLPLNQICSETETTVIVLTHTRKNMRGKTGMDIESMSGAGVTEFARQWMMIDRIEKFDPSDPNGTHKLQVSCGGAHGFGADFYLTITEGSYQHHGERWWSPEVEFLEQAKEGQAVEELANAKTAIMKYLEGIKDGDTKRRIRDGAKLHNAIASQALTALVDERKVKECHIHKNGRDYAGFVLSGLSGEPVV